MPATGCEYFCWINESSGLSGLIFARVTRPFRWRPSLSLSNETGQMGLPRAVQLRKKVNAPVPAIASPPRTIMPSRALRRALPWARGRRAQVTSKSGAGLGAARGLGAEGDPERGEGGERRQREEE